MNVIFFSGRIGKDAEMRSTTSGEVLSFSVAVQQGISRDAKSEWYRCSIWGQRANSLKQHLTKGAKVAVVGQLTIGEYDGKAQYNVNVNEIDPFCGGKRDGKDDARDTGQRGGATAVDHGNFKQEAFDADLDDSDLPF